MSTSTSHREQAWTDYLHLVRTLRDETRYTAVDWDAGYDAALTLAVEAIEALAEIVDGYPEFQHATEALARYRAAVG